MAICGWCKHKICCHAFCDTECIKCKKKITTGHIPGYIVCKDCSSKFDICEQCGGPMFRNWTKEDLKRLEKLIELESSHDEIDKITVKMQWRSFKDKFTEEQLKEMRQALKK